MYANKPIQTTSVSYVWWLRVRTDPRSHSEEIVKFLRPYKLPMKICVYTPIITF